MTRWAVREESDFEHTQIVITEIIAQLEIINPAWNGIGISGLIEQSS